MESLQRQAPACVFELTVSHAYMPQRVENSPCFGSAKKSCVGHMKAFTQPVSELTSLLLFLVAGYATLTVTESILATTHTRGNVFNTD